MTRNGFLLSAILFAVSTNTPAQTYYGNGYTIVDGGVTTGDDLDAKVFKSITAYNVEEGLHQLLQGSGWSLAGYASADPGIWRLYQQPYPDNKRTISPMALADALQWIAGNGWVLVVDRVNRLVSFEVNDRYAPIPLPPPPKAASTSSATNAELAAAIADSRAAVVEAVLPQHSSLTDSSPSKALPIGQAQESYDFGSFISNTQTTTTKKSASRRKEGKS